MLPQLCVFKAQPTCRSLWPQDRATSRKKHLGCSQLTEEGLCSPALQNSPRRLRSGLAGLLESPMTHRPAPQARGPARRLAGECVG